MVRLLIVPILLLFLSGCSGNTTNVQDSPWGPLAVKNAARGLGYAVANSKSTVDDAAVEEAYALITTGQIDPTKFNGILERFKKDPANQLVILAALDLMQAMGATVTTGSVVDVSKIPPEMLTMAEIAYKQGYAVGKMDKTKGITRAVP